ncbi:hypothetical protein WA158_005462 [Blastocystis sp. Blastoise]
MLYLFILLFSIGQLICQDVIQNNIKWPQTTATNDTQEVNGSCLTGYKPSSVDDTFVRKCEPTGFWSVYDPTFGTCIELFCEEETKSGYVWPKTKAGKSAILSCNEAATTGQVQRQCLLKTNPTRAVWDNYVVDSCNYSPIVAINYPITSLTVDQMEVLPNYLKPSEIDGFYSQITISPRLPSSVKFDEVTGQITGRFIDPLETTIFVITFSNRLHSYSVEISITVNAIYCEPTEKFGKNWPTTQAGKQYTYDCTDANQTGQKSLYCLRSYPPRWSDYLSSDCVSSIPRNIIYPSFHLKLRRNIKMADHIPMYLGVVSSVSAINALPAGLSVDSTTGTISGVPLKVVSESKYTIRFQGTSDELYQDVDLFIEVLERTCPYIQENNYIFPESIVDTIANGLCPLGYSGTVTRPCLESGEWDTINTIEANCQPNYCPETTITGDHISTLVLPKTIGVTDYTYNCTYGSYSFHCRADGTWTNMTSTCRKCPDGEYLGLFEQGTACIPCPIGQICPSGTGYRDPISCTGVWYNDEQGATECKQCNLKTSYIKSNEMGGIECIECPTGTYPLNNQCVANLYCPAEDGFEETRTGLIGKKACSSRSLKGYISRQCIRTEDNQAIWGDIDDVTNCLPYVPPSGVQYFDLTFELQNLQIHQFTSEAKYLFLNELIKGYNHYMSSIIINSVEGYYHNDMNYVLVNVRVSTEIDIIFALKTLFYTPIPDMYVSLDIYNNKDFNRWFKIILRGDYYSRYNNLYCPEDGIWSMTVGGQTAYASCEELNMKGYMERYCRYVWGQGYVEWKDENTNGCLDLTPPTGHAYIDATLYFINLLPYVFNCDSKIGTFTSYMKIADTYIYDVKIHTIRNITMNKLPSTSLELRLEVPDELATQIASNIENNIQELYTYFRAVDSYRFHPNFRVAVQLPISVTSSSTPHRQLREATNKFRNYEWSPSI